MIQLRKPFPSQASKRMIHTSSIQNDISCLQLNWFNQNLVFMHNFLCFQKYPHKSDNIPKRFG